MGQALKTRDDEVKEARIYFMDEFFPVSGNIRRRPHW